MSADEQPVRRPGDPDPDSLWEREQRRRAGFGREPFGTGEFGSPVVLDEWTSQGGCAG